MNYIFVIPTLQSVEAFFIPLAVELLETGNSVTILTNTKSEENVFIWDITPPENLEIAHCDIPRVPNPLKIKSAQAQIYALASQHSRSIIHGHFLMGSLIVASLHSNSSYYKICTLHSLVENDFGGLKKLVIKFLERQIALKSDLLYLLNNQDFDRFKKFKSVAKLPGYGMGIDETRFKNIDSHRENRIILRKELGLKKDSLVFIYAGRLIAGKGIDELIEGFKMAQINEVNIELIICGDQDPAYRKFDFKELVGVHFFGWQPILQDYFAMADVYATASYREGMSVSCMEALYCGLPLLSGPTKGIMDLVKHEENGFIVKHITAEEFKRGFEYFWENRKRIQEFSINAQNGRDKYLRSHSTKTHLEEYKKIENTILN